MNTRRHLPSRVIPWILLAALFLLLFPSTFRWTYNQILPHWRARPYNLIIHQISAQYGLDPRLLESLIWRESRFDPHQRGTAGEIGLMQIRPSAMLDYCRSQRIAPHPLSDLSDPTTNLTIGAWYLARALQRWSDRDDPRPFALAEYNAGLINARKWAAEPHGISSADFRKQITFPTTRRYIEDILSRLPPVTLSPTTPRDPAPKE